MCKKDTSVSYSNKDFKRLGDRIRNNVTNIAEEDYEMLQYLRTSYKTSLSLVFNTIEGLAHKIDKDCVCTYRIKRIESIISKLIRFPEMQINRAEDIAGCRCILTSENKVYELLSLIKKKEKSLPFEIKGKINDYITNPKESGYRSLHINVTLRGDNKRIEIQIRSLEHHNWATLVEITDLLYGLKLKEFGQQSNPDLYRLHFLLSKDPQTLTVREINHIADTIIKHEYLQTLGTVFANNYIDVRKHWNSLKLQSKHFFLISTSKTGTPEIQGFSYFDEAESQYFELFIKNRSHNNIVLTHLKNTNFAKISVAYSNYFLTFNNTMFRILGILSMAVEISFNKNQVRRFSRYYQAFLNIMLFWMEKQIIELDSFNKDENIRKSKKKHQEWAVTIQTCAYVFRNIFNHTQSKLKYKIWNTFTYMLMRSKYQEYTYRRDEIIAQNAKDETHE